MTSLADIFIAVAQTAGEAAARKNLPCNPPAACSESLKTAWIRGWNSIHQKAQVV